MSSLTTLARPYAKAAFSLAREAGTGALKSWQDMLSLASEIASDPTVAGLLDNPLVAPAQAAELLVAAGGGRFNERFASFLGVLGANRRLPLLAEITKLFGQLKQAEEQQLLVRVVAAQPLSEDQAVRMKEALARRFKCAIELKTEIDPGVLGGAVLYAGDQVIDGSLQGRLNKLRTALAL